MNPMRVLRLFRAISARDAELLDMAGRPEDLLVTAVPVPPVVIRPSVEMDSGAGSNEDDCTMRLMVGPWHLFIHPPPHTHTHTHPPTPPTPPIPRPTSPTWSARFRTPVAAPLCQMQSSSRCKPRRARKLTTSAPVRGPAANNRLQQQGASVPGQRRQNRARLRPHRAVGLPPGARLPTPATVACCAGGLPREECCLASLGIAAPTFWGPPGSTRAYHLALRNFSPRPCSV